MSFNLYPVNSNPLVSLMITHSNLKLTIPEVKFSLMEPICEIKLSLVKRIGTDVDSMDLQLKDEHNNFVANMNEDLRPLGYYSPKDKYIIHVKYLPAFLHFKYFSKVLIYVGH
jgi:Ubiquitin-like domain